MLEKVDIKMAFKYFQYTYLKGTYLLANTQNYLTTWLIYYHGSLRNEGYLIPRIIWMTNNHGTTNNLTTCQTQLDTFTVCTEFGKPLTNGKTMHLSQFFGHNQ